MARVSFTRTHHSGGSGLAGTTAASVVGNGITVHPPVVVTALTAILAMVPLSGNIFWGPMAITIMGGLLVATVLTLLVVPALYALWFRVREGEPAAMGTDAGRSSAEDVVLFPVAAE